MRHERTDDGPVRRDHFPDHLRLHDLAAVCERGVGGDELHWRHRVVALADAGLVHLAGVNGQSLALELPIVRRHDAGRFARQIDAGALSEPELMRPVPEPVDAEPARELEEERVT